jgi:hypothetical protein
MKKSYFTRINLCCLLLLGSAQSALAVTERPPQIVEFAFDGSLTIPFWQKSRDFAKDVERVTGKPFHFTYFISGVYFLTHANKFHYVNPHTKVTASDIGFGGDANDLLARIAQVNASIADGDAIGSHANGHFDGSKWSFSDWNDEFNAFVSLLDNTYFTNKLLPTGNQPAQMNIKGDTIKGFRAPYLGRDQAMYDVLAAHHFRYDTSKTSATSYWPQKSAGGVWNFPLGEVRIAGTAKKTLSMDYNFFYSQSNAVPDPNPEHLKVFEKQMYDTYMQYFASNYNGNRAPVHIGHHFLMMNHGIYWQAMQEFARTVCGVPEVKCINYDELANFMDGLTPATLTDYQRANFPKGPSYVLPADMPKPLEINFTVAEHEDHMHLSASGADASQIAIDGTTVHWEVNGDPVGTESNRLAFTDIAPLMTNGSAVLSAVSSKDGKEILRVTHRIKADPNNSQKIMLDSEDLEGYPTKGDLSEAHEINPDDVQ